MEVPEGRRAPGDEAFALDLLRAQGVHLHPGRLFGFPESDRRFHLVAGLLTPEADFRAGLERLRLHAEAWLG
jgi:aspartate/methionine/tyrosine aminotransferase